MKKLINNGNRCFAIRKDRDYLADLLSIGITEDLAWNEILTLNKSHYKIDYRPCYSKSGTDALVFLKIINGYLVYIKLKLEKYNNNEMTVCLSFHLSDKDSDKYV